MTIRRCLGCDNLYLTEDDDQEFCDIDCHERTLNWRGKPIVCDYCDDHEASEVDHIESGRYTRVVACLRCLAILGDQWIYSFHRRRAFVKEAIARLATGI